jgi:hypothetical protein
VFCLEHRSRFVHDCRDCDTFNETPKRDLSHLPKVKDLLLAVENRFQSEVTKTAAKEHWSSVMGSTSKSSAAKGIAGDSTVFSRSLDKLRQLQHDSSRSAEVQQRAERTQQLLIKRRAMGNLSIPEEDRVYLTIHFVAPHPLEASSETIFPDVEADPLCLQYVFFPRNKSLGETLQQLKDTHFSMIRSTFRLSGNWGVADRVALALYTLDSPDWRLWDRDIQLGHLCRNFEETWVTVVMIEDVIASQKELSAPLPISELLHHGHHHPSPSPAAAAAAPAAVPTASAPIPQIAKGDVAWYHRGSNGIPLVTLQDAERNSIPVILVKVIGVHHDDFPNVYYTIAPINPPTIQRHGASEEDCERLTFHAEKQTDSNRVIAAPERRPAAAPAAAAAPPSNPRDSERQKQELVLQKQRLLQLFASKAQTSGLWGTDAFTITVSYAGNDEAGVTIAPRVTVGELREFARCIIALAKLGTANPALARAADVKLIAKGVQLKQDHQLVRDTKLAPGGKLVIMG